MQKSEQATITDWVILSLESFLQQLSCILCGMSVYLTCVCVGYLLCLCLCYVHVYPTIYGDGAFIYREPEERALWTVTALLLASSTNEILRNLYPSL